MNDLKFEHKSDLKFLSNKGRNMGWEDIAQKKPIKSKFGACNKNRTSIHDQDEPKRAKLVKAQIEDINNKIENCVSVS